jgi:hypothetical protein
MKQSRILVFALLALVAWSCGRNSTTVPPATNKSPETVLVATPYDTSFLKTPAGGIPTAVIYRYHGHWYGADSDGKVIGYSVIVTDTNAVPGLADFQDPAHFTTRTDSIFTFEVTAQSQRYPHTLWVSAVDDKFKADYSPAHVILNAEDRFLPEPIVEESYAIIPGGRQVFLSDDGTRAGKAPRDTIPLGSLVHFRWHAAPMRSADQAAVVGFKVRLGANYVFTTDTSITYLADKLPPGRNEFHIKAVDAVKGETGAGGAPDTVRLFAYNFAPSTWFTDPNTVALPAELRPSQRRFYEVHDGKLTAHADGDTISRMSNIRLAFGGWDRDGQVRGFSVQIKNTLVGGGGSQPPPSATTPPAGSIEVFEPFLNEPFEFNTGSSENNKAGVRTFTVKAFDYQGQVDPNGAKITVVCGFRPYFKPAEIRFQVGAVSFVPFPSSGPDTVVVDSLKKVLNQTITVTAPAYDGNDPTGTTRIGVNPAVNQSYIFTLDPESASPTVSESSGPVQQQPFEIPSTPGLHVIEVKANDYLNGQTLGDGREARIRIPFVFIRMR